MKKFILSIIFLQALHAYASDINLTDQEKFAVALCKGNHVLADEYLSCGKVDVNAPINFFSNFDIPPLVKSAENINLLMMRVLLNHGANPHAQDSAGNTVLHKFARTPNSYKNSRIIPPLINHFINLGVDLTIQNEKGNTALTEAAEWEKSSDVIEALMINNSADKQDALLAAIDGYQPKNISTLLFHGATVTEKHKTSVMYYEPLYDERIAKKQNKCHDLVMNGTKSDYFLKRCFGQFKKNDKRNVFQIVKGRERDKKK